MQILQAAHFSTHKAGRRGGVPTARGGGYVPIFWADGRGGTVVLYVRTVLRCDMELRMYLWDYVCPCRGRRFVTEHRLTEGSIRVWDPHAVAVPWSEYVLDVRPLSGQNTSTLGASPLIESSFKLDFSKYSRPPF